MNYYKFIPQSETKLVYPFLKRRKFTLQHAAMKLFAHLETMASSMRSEHSSFTVTKKLAVCKDMNGPLISSVGKVFALYYTTTMRF